MTTIMSLLVGFVIFGGIVFVLWLGARDVISGVMTAGTLSQFVMYAIMAWLEMRMTGWAHRSGFAAQ